MSAAARARPHAVYRMVHIESNNYLIVTTMNKNINPDDHCRRLNETASLPVHRKFNNFALKDFADLYAPVNPKDFTIEVIAQHCANAEEARARALEYVAIEGGEKLLTSGFIDNDVWPRHVKGKENITRRRLTAATKPDVKSGAVIAHFESSGYCVNIENRPLGNMNPTTWQLLTVARLQNEVSVLTESPDTQSALCRDAKRVVGIHVSLQLLTEDRVSRYRSPPSLKTHNFYHFGPNYEQTVVEMGDYIATLIARHKTDTVYKIYP